jgi:hypothetical protein
MLSPGEDYAPPVARQRGPAPPPVNNAGFTG